MKNQVEENKRIVREWHELALRAPEEAVATYIGPTYRQHNPGASDGAESLVATMKWFVQNFPHLRIDTKRVIAEGDYVVLHNHLILEPGDRGSAVVEMFRLEDGRIVEHWDVVQEIPEASANDNTMF